MVWSQKYKTKLEFFAIGMASLLGDTVGGVVRPPCVSSRTFGKLVNNIHTDFVIINYSNRVLIIVTTIGKIGNLFALRQSSSQAVAVSSPNPKFIYEIECILGAETEEIKLAVRSLAEKLCIGKPALLSLTLPVLDYNTVSQVANAIVEHKCW